MGQSCHVGRVIGAALICHYFLQQGGHAVLIPHTLQPGARPEAPGIDLPHPARLWTAANRQTLLLPCCCAAWCQTWPQPALMARSARSCWRCTGRPSPPMARPRCARVWGVPHSPCPFLRPSPPRKPMPSVPHSCPASHAQQPSLQRSPLAGQGQVGASRGSGSGGPPSGAEQQLAVWRLHAGQRAGGARLRGLWAAAAQPRRRQQPMAAAGTGRRSFRGGSTTGACASADRRAGCPKRRVGGSSAAGPRPRACCCSLSRGSCGPCCPTSKFCGRLPSAARRCPLPRRRQQHSGQRQQRCSWWRQQEEGQEEPSGVCEGDQGASAGALLGCSAGPTRSILACRGSKHPAVPMPACRSVPAALLSAPASPARVSCMGCPSRYTAVGCGRSARLQLL